MKRKMEMIIAWATVFLLFPGCLWAQSAGPMSLKESIDLALKQSVLIHASREGVRGAEAQQREAATGFLPKFNTTYSYTRLNDNPHTVIGPLPPPIPTAAQAQVGTADNYDWTISLKQPLYTGGALTASYRISELGANAARMDQQTVTSDTVQDVTVSYFNILKAQKILGVARQSVEQLQAHRDVAQDFFDVGLIPRNDLLQSEVQLANGRQFLVQAENGVELAKARFNTLLRRDIETPLEVEDIMTYTPFGKSIEECLRIALQNRTELKSYALRLEQAKAGVTLARSDFFPKLNLMGNYERFGDHPNVEGSYYKDRETWYVMAVASWDFWEWGRTKDRVDANLARENQASDVLMNVRDQITLELKNAFLMLRQSEKQVGVAKKAIEQAEENFRINEERYKEQVSTSTDVIDALTLLTRAKSDYAGALGDFCISRARLERAMGVIYGGEDK
ncbi:MAG: TolC family protein [Smithellaceae bacterium]|nr:TolC family protein [Smithellaceae bacterium]